jgi:hypothetical protein
MAKINRFSALSTADLIIDAVYVHDTRAIPPTIRSGNCQQAYQKLRSDRHPVVVIAGADICGMCCIYWI